MLRNLRPIASLLGGTAILLLGMGLLNSLIPLRGQALGFSTTVLGGLTSAYYAGYFIGTFTLPPLIQRIGHIRAFAFCTAALTVIVLLHIIDAQPWVWLLLRLLSGGVVVGLYAIIESWLNAQAEPSRRGAVFAVYMVVNLCALAAAQPLLGIDRETFVLFALVALLVSAAALPVVSTRQAQPTLQTAPRLRWRRLFEIAPSAGICALLSGLAMGAFWGLLPLYAQDRGYDLTHIGYYISAGILGGAALQWPLGRWSDGHDRRYALTVVCAAAGVIAALQLLMPSWPALDLTMIFLYGGMAFAVYPLAMAHLADQMPAQELLAAGSSVLLAFGAGSALGPLAAGALMAATWPGALFMWFAGVQLLCAGYALHCYRYVRHRGSGGHFRVMLRTTPAAFDLMPERDADATAGEPAASRQETPSDAA